MITARLMGGLGNQLFQIATTMALAINNDDDYAFDFNIPCVNQGNSPMLYRESIYRTLPDLPSDWKPSVTYHEKSFGYNPIPYQENMELVGYFQSEKYFAELWGYLRFMVMGEFVDNEFDIGDDVCSLHVRRGDYLKFPSYHPLMDMDYYEKSIEIAREYGARKFAVFSDDIEWCISNFKGSEFIFMDRDDYTSLRMMISCPYHIIANSSFSWWGAWLGEEGNGIDIAPQKWLGQKTEEEQVDVVPNRWIRI